MKVKDKHRLVKIQYCVLKEFLDIIASADGIYTDSYGWSEHTRIHYSINKSTKRKAKNILNNS